MRRTADAMAFCPQQLHFTMNDRRPNPNACLSQAHSNPSTSRTRSTSGTTTSGASASATTASNESFSLFVHSQWQPQQTSPEAAERIRKYGPCNSIILVVHCPEKTTCCLVLLLSISIYKTFLLQQTQFCLQMIFFPSFIFA